MIPQETVQLILDTARVEDVVGDFVTLKRRGSSLWACCPFHNEKTPSFHVEPSRGIYKCFGCGKSGTAVGFIMEYEKEALLHGGPQVPGPQVPYRGEGEGGIGRGHRRAPAQREPPRRLGVRLQLLQGAARDGRRPLRRRPVFPFPRPRGRDHRQVRPGMGPEVQERLHGSGEGEGLQGRIPAGNGPLRPVGHGRLPARPLLRPGDVPDPFGERPRHRLRRTHPVHRQVPRSRRST